MARVGRKECYPAQRFACVPVACGRRPVIVTVFQLYCGSDEVPWTPSHRQKRGRLSHQGLFYARVRPVTNIPRWWRTNKSVGHAGEMLFAGGQCCVRYSPEALQHRYEPRRIRQPEDGREAESTRNKQLIAPFVCVRQV
jgi:hypothetical protein